MSSRRRSQRHSFYGTAIADEKRVEKRYNQVRQRRMSAFQEADLTKLDGQITISQDHTLRNFPGSQRNRSGSLPDPTQLGNMAIKLENETGAMGECLTRPRSVSFDPTAKLYTAAAENDTAELERVLDTGKADPNCLYLSGIAPLHVAAAEGHLETIKLLVNYGANINILGTEGCSPLEFALRGAHFDCAAFLIKVGAETKKIVHDLN